MPRCPYPLCGRYIPTTTYPFVCWAKVTSSQPFTFHAMTSSVKIPVISAVDRSFLVEFLTGPLFNIFSSRFGSAENQNIAHNFDQRPLLSAKIFLGGNHNKYFESTNETEWKEKEKNDGTRATESYLLVTGARFVPNSTRDTAQTALSLSPPRSLTSAKFNVLPLVCRSSCPPSFVPHFLAIARAIARVESSLDLSLTCVLSVYCLVFFLFFLIQVFGYFGTYTCG